MQSLFTSMADTIRSKPLFAIVSSDLVRNIHNEFYTSSQGVRLKKITRLSIFAIL
jgi:hypothetical protein